MKLRGTYISNFRTSLPGGFVNAPLSRRQNIEWKTYQILRDIAMKIIFCGEDNQ